MTILEIPRAFIYTCDFCGAEHRQECAVSHYSNSTPGGWLTLRVLSNDAPLKQHLCCEGCSEKINKAILQIMSERKVP